MISHKTYFEEVGIWPKRSQSVLGEYIFGFILSLVLTVAAYVIATQPVFSPVITPLIVIGLIVIQFFIQVRFFLHLKFSKASTERLASLGFAVLIVGILLIGSLWIMQNLNNRMMPSMEQMNNYMIRNPGL